MDIVRLRKEVIITLMILVGLSVSSCNRSTCPSFDQNTGKMEIPKAKKTSSGVFPKSVQKELKKGK